MKASKIMEKVIGKDFLESWSWTVDTCKAGDPDQEVTKLAVCFAPTPEVIRAASAWGAQLLITHEPTYYNHIDQITSSPLADVKKALVDASGLTIYRYHDSMHFREEDSVSRSFLNRMGWIGEFDGQMLFTLQNPMTPLEIAQNIRDRLGLTTLRFIGRQDGTVKKIGVYLGARDEGCYQNFLDGDVDLAICGELCEWQFGEPVREAAQFGSQKTMLLLGHAASEKFAMEDFAKEAAGQFPDLAVKYFECGDLFFYI